MKKFRAWDSEKQEMILPPEPYSSNKGMYLLTMDGYCYVEGKLQEQLIWMQFTGLQDKNGKDIYEGDLIKVIGAESGEMIMHIDDITCMPLSTLYPAGEIIGNIHQNPELLEK